MYVFRIGIFFKINGNGKCSWSKTLKRNESTAAPANCSTDQATNDKDHFLHMAGEENYFPGGMLVYIAGSKHGKFLLLSHRHCKKKTKTRSFMSHFWSFRSYYIHVIT